MIRIIIADDEPAALASLEILLGREKELTIVARCKNGLEATEAILLHKPDLVFLDVQMPDRNGFEVLDAVKEHHLCVYVFVTAYDQYAIKAFDQSAVDYLLKPYDDERFFKSLEKARQLLAGRQSALFAERLISLIGHSKTQEPYTRRLVSKINGNVSLIATQEVKYIESCGNFVQLHTLDSRVMPGNYSLKKLLLLLDPDQFIQIHKSIIVNIDSIALIEPHFHGDYMITLKDRQGTKLKLSRNFKSLVHQVLNI